MKEVNPPERIPNDKLNERLEHGDRVRVIQEKGGTRFISEFGWGGYDEVYQVNVNDRGVRLPHEVDLWTGEVYLIGKFEREWPTEAGTPILVLETTDPLGEAGLPEAPFIATVTTLGRFAVGHNIWHRNFASQWRELSIRENMRGDRLVEVSK
jgi:hypothetical protein